MGDGRKPSGEPGLLLYVMMDDVAATNDVVIANGGELVQPISGDAPEITERVKNPAGNTIALYQEPQ